MPPHIVLITLDQWRYDAAGFAGSPYVRTPHLDSLAARGTVFAVTGLMELYDFVHVSDVLDPETLTFPGVLLVFFPGAAILALALAFNLVGDALRDILDPTQRGRE